MLTKHKQKYTEMINNGANSTLSTNHPANWNTKIDILGILFWFFKKNIAIFQIFAKAQKLHGPENQKRNVAYYESNWEKSYNLLSSHEKSLVENGASEKKHNVKTSVKIWMSYIKSI